jgi:hypothetical protein
MKDEIEFLKIEDYLGPRKICINSLAINLISTPIDRAHQTFELQEFENALLEKISPTLQSKLPTIQLSQSNLEKSRQKRRNPADRNETNRTKYYRTRSISTFSSLPISQQKINSGKLSIFPEHGPSDKRYQGKSSWKEYPTSIHHEKRNSV